MFDDVSYLLEPQFHNIPDFLSISPNRRVPSVDNFVLDVNGRVKISHSEIVLVSKTNYEIRNMIFRRGQFSVAQEWRATPFKIVHPRGFKIRNLTGFRTYTSCCFHAALF